MGNRTRYTETITSTNIITYAYDAANRLTNVDGVAYTWGDNPTPLRSGDWRGNLLSDGSKTYTYTQANRLIAVSDQQSAFSFVYNGDGARVKQVVDGHGITYTLDLAAPLVVVLAERSGTTTTHYVYALGTRPLAQYGPHPSPPPPAGEGVWAYLLPDALGSVRQLIDADGNVTLAQAYQPYGSLLERAGSGTSTFGYAGEQADESGLIYLRARMYQPGLGVFLSRDLWEGNYQQPSTLHAYLYVLNNPVKYTDPTGYQGCSPGEEECQYGADERYQRQQVQTLIGYARSTFEITITGSGWDYVRVSAVVDAARQIDSQFRQVAGADAARAQELAGTREACQQGLTAEDFRRLGGLQMRGVGDAFRAIYGSVTFTHVNRDENWWGETFTRNGQEVIEVYDDAFDAGADFTFHFPAHELGHAFAHRTGGPDGQPRVPYDDLTNAGFGAFAPGDDWQQSDSNTASEDFADMFLGWAGNNLVANRNAWMNDNMARWMALAVTENR